MSSAVYLTTLLFGRFGPLGPTVVMSSAVSLPYHTFTGQVWSSGRLAGILHILLPETDNQQKGENDRKKYFTIRTPQKKNVANSARAEPATS